MAEGTNVAAVDDGDGGKKGGGKLPLLVGIVAALALGGGGFYATYSGLILGDGDASGMAAQADAPTIKELSDVAFVPMEPILISLPRGASAEHLRFTGELEVSPELAEEVSILMPRILDALNTYLRAVKIEDLENPASMVRLRAQMLRRVQVVAGEGRVRDLLITEFVMS